MISYVARRLVLAAVVILLILFLLVAVVYVVPGDPARILLGRQATPDLIAVVRNSMGLDRPFLVQVWAFIAGALHGDLGNDFVSQSPVTTLIGGPLVNTSLLAFFSMLLSVSIGVPIGILAARRPGGLFDRSVRAASIIVISAPGYVVALALLLVFTVQLHYVLAFGAGTLDDPLDYLKRLVLPAVALASYWWAYLARFVRASMLEVLGFPYVRTARAYGISEFVIYFKLALKNALVPVTALMGLMLGYTLAGTVYVEVIFGRSGLGSLALSAIDSRDWPVVRAVVLIYALFFILGNLGADVLYRFLDPRIRVDQASEVFI